MFGEHLIKSWATTQGVIALSSGEAEYYSIVKGGSIALGIRNIMTDMGVESKIKIKTDASAAKGIASRRGAGKIRHIEVSQLWIQDKVAKGEIEIIKVHTKENLADALTKHVGSEELSRHIACTHQAIIGARHDLAPKLEEINLIDQPDAEVVRQSAMQLRSRFDH